ncbi:MAG: calcium/sodium antiporter [Traorella sp.]
MLQEILFIIIGFILLIKGADLLVDGSSNIAKKLHVPDIVIGLTIVSIGTSMPELFVSTTSALDGLSDMAIGNVIGSNICNLLLILGVSALIHPIQFQRRTHRIEIPMCLGITVIFALLCNIGLDISFRDSLILLFLFIIFIGYTFYVAKKGREEDDISEDKEISTFKSIFLIIVGIFALKIGGDLSVDHSVIVAQILGLSDKVIGLTILAIGTSLPELVTSVVASMKGNDDIAIGNIIGSNIFNMLLIIGVSAFITPITYNPSYNTQIILLIVSLVLLYIFPLTKEKEKMGRFNGFIYLVLYVGYMILLFVQ